MPKQDLRSTLIAIALAWQDRYGVAPQITSALSELDASKIVGMTDEAYAAYMAKRTAVSRGCDLAWQGARYQVKANRPSGKAGSRVTMVPKAKNFDWDYLIWILYDSSYNLLEAWKWSRESYEAAFSQKTRLSPDDYRRGERVA